MDPYFPDCSVLYRKPWTRAQNARKNPRNCIACGHIKNFPGRRSERGYIFRPQRNRKRLLAEFVGLQMEPLICVWTERKQIRTLADGWKAITPKNLHWYRIAMLGQVQFHALRETGEIGNHQNLFVCKFPHKCQYLAIGWKQELYCSPAKGGMLFSLRYHALHPP